LPEGVAPAPVGDESCFELHVRLGGLELDVRGHGLPQAEASRKRRDLTKRE